LVIGRLVASSLIKRVIASNLENMPGGYPGTVESVAIRTLEWGVRRAA
jgi:hypothetical protein